MSNNLSDQALWEAIKNDDIKAFKQLFDRYWSKIFTTAFNRLRDRESCIEITNDIFIMLWQKRDRLNINSFSNYLQASTRYHVYRHCKLLKVAPFQHVDDIEMLSLRSNSDEGDYNLRYHELESMVSCYLNQLPKRCREIFKLSRTEQLSNDEIAERLNISKRTVENQITHALKHLRISLKGLFVISLIISILNANLK